MYGREYFFGAGVQRAGEHEFPALYALQPTRTLELGITEIPADVFDAWLADVTEGRFAPHAYHCLLYTSPSPRD